MQELKGAANQKELVVAQRKLARYQRIAEEKGALAAKVVKAVPSWIVEDAQKQAQLVAEKKKQKAEREASGSGSTNKGGGASASDDVSGTVSTTSAADLDGSKVSPFPCEEDLQVECLGCSTLASWQDLQPGDGMCAACLVGAAELMESSKPHVAHVEPAPASAAAALASGIDAAAPPPQRSAWRGRRARDRQDILAASVQRTNGTVVGAS
jgi:hypothetical protein